ncbi:MAG: serine/threonine protein kinase, partial [Anaerolineae bacterium]|nr:serine/threonine protein kinase [Anaerolineae bacterium]
MESHYVEGMALAPDGRTFATSSWNGTLIFWDAVARKQLEEILANPQGYVNTLAFSPDGETL